MKFMMTVRDAKTGQVIHGPVNVNGDLQEFGGKTAQAAEARGITQKVRVRQHLAGTVQQQLITAGFGVLR